MNGGLDNISNIMNHRYLPHSIDINREYSSTTNSINNVFPLMAFPCKVFINLVLGSRIVLATSHGWGIPWLICDCGKEVLSSVYRSIVVLVPIQLKMGFENLIGVSWFGHRTQVTNPLMHHEEQSKW